MGRRLDDIKLLAELIGSPQEIVKLLGEGGRVRFIDGSATVDSLHDGEADTARHVPMAEATGLLLKIRLQGDARTERLLTSGVVPVTRTRARASFSTQAPLEKFILELRT